MGRGLLPLGAMAWWHYLLASIEAVLVAVLVLLWYDMLRDRRDWPQQRARAAAFKAATTIPVGFLIVLVLPLWPALVLVAIPAIAIATMALVD